MTTTNGLDAEAYDRVRSFAWCSWHKGFTDTARLVRITEQGSARAGGSSRARRAERSTTSCRSPTSRCDYQAASRRR